MCCVPCRRPCRSCTVSVDCLAGTASGVASVAIQLVLSARRAREQRASTRKGLHGRDLPFFAACSYYRTVCACFGCLFWSWDSSVTRYLWRRWARRVYGHAHGDEASGLGGQGPTCESLNVSNLVTFRVWTTQRPCPLSSHAGTARAVTSTTQDSRTSITGYGMSMTSNTPGLTARRQGSVGNAHASLSNLA